MVYFTIGATAPFEVLPHWLGTALSERPQDLRLRREQQQCRFHPRARAHARPSARRLVRGGRRDRRTAPALPTARCCDSRHQVATRSPSSARTVGLSVVLLAKAMGTRVIAVDVSPIRLRPARGLGADYTINSRETEPLQAIADLTHGDGADLAVNSPATPRHGPRWCAASASWAVASSSARGARSGSTSAPTSLRSGSR